MQEGKECRVIATVTLERGKTTTFSRDKPCRDEGEAAIAVLDMMRWYGTAQMFVVTIVRT